MSYLGAEPVRYRLKSYFILKEYVLIEECPPSKAMALTLVFIIFL